VIDAATARVINERVDAIQTALGLDFAADALDVLVIDCSAEIASGVNNCGVPAQLEYLLRNGWTADDILGRLRIDKEEDGE
jgi:hypothetical protein